MRVVSITTGMYLTSTKTGIDPHTLVHRAELCFEHAIGALSLTFPYGEVSLTKGED